VSNVARQQTRQIRTGCAILLALGLLMGGCSGDPFGRSSPSTPGASGSSPSLGDRFSNLFRSQPAAQDQGAVAPVTPPQTIDCPTVTIRQGASTFAVSMPGVDPSAMNLRYQANFGQISRDCQLEGATVKMRVGIEGRVILGPAGAVGQVELPLRLAVVVEGPEPKVIMTKLRWISVVIPPDQPNIPFAQIEEDLSFPMPAQPVELDAYVVYVGFDPAAVKVPEKKPPAKKPAAKPRR
jgi:hypothetical protein